MQTWGRGLHSPGPSQAPASRAQYEPTYWHSVSEEHAVADSSQLPMNARLAPTLAAKQGFEYVIPSQPQTG